MGSCLCLDASTLTVANFPPQSNFHFWEKNKKQKQTHAELWALI